jgi:uncharacterized membrane protein
MDERIPPTVGILVCLVVVAVVVAPFLVLPPSESAGLSTYYASGIAGGYGVGLLALVALVAFAGGRQRRTEPDTVAGATLVVGVGMVVLALQWALAVDAEVLQSITTAAWMADHRWVLVGLSALVPVASGWYARAVGVV